MKREMVSPQTDSRESSPVALPSIVLANQQCSRIATGELSPDNAFDLIEGHPAPHDYLVEADELPGAPRRLQIRATDI